MHLNPDRDGSIGYLTNLAARLFARALERRLTGSGLGPMPVFVALIRGEALPQKHLARLAAVEQPTMASTLARMERDGLVERAPDPLDHRSTLISLTETGLARGHKALEAARLVDGLGLSALAPEERGPFLGMLQRVIARLEADA